MTLARLLEKVNPRGTGKALILDPVTEQPDGSEPVDVRQRYPFHVGPGIAHIADVGGSWEIVAGEPEVCKCCGGMK